MGQHGAIREHEPMKNQYEATYILDIQSKDETVRAALDMLKKEIDELGGEMLSSQKMDRRKFERIAGKMDSGYYLALQIELDSDKVTTLTNKLKLNKTVYRQFYTKKAEDITQPAA